ncbi:hypothetical protein OS493_037523 [Desmophyllum pertusum]|uniref:Ig-like domain-containing protein n=1 Tax=Desmophyllum pertusum TaxID=174260 RepID=A0A9X0D6B8_9CNID|nr:hypothetical protein OS493_037523 [Desmophyllum pertusum]
MGFSARQIILVVLCSAVGIAKAELAIGRPFPKIIYPIEYSSAQVTCVAYDSSGVEVPEKILFVRQDQFATYVTLKTNDSLYFTNRTEENGRKLFVTLHFRNVTMEDDSTSGQLGSYECHAYAVNSSDPKKYGFSVNVISANEIPKLAVSKAKVLQHGVNTTITCTLTERGSLNTRLQRVSWLKDGVLNKSVSNPNQQNYLGPLVLKDVGVKNAGRYTCLLEVQLRGNSPYNVSASTMITIAPWFENEGETVVMKKTGENATLECSAKGIPLNVEWKIKKENKEMVASCVDSSTDKRYKITRKDEYDPYLLTVTDLVMADNGSYYCCLPSNCAANVDEDRCQRFVLTVKGTVPD